MISQPLLRGKTKDAVVKYFLTVLSVVALFTCVVLVHQNHQITELRQSVAQVLPSSSEMPIGGRYLPSKPPHPSWFTPRYWNRPDDWDLKWVWHEKKEGSGLNWLVCQTRVGGSPTDQYSHCFVNYNTDEERGEPYKMKKISWSAHENDNLQLKGANQARLGWRTMCQIKKNSNGVWDILAPAFGCKSRPFNDVQSSWMKFDPKPYDPSFGWVGEHRTCWQSMSTQYANSAFFGLITQYANSQTFVEVIDNTFCPGGPEGYGQNYAKMQPSHAIDYKGLDESGLGHWNNAETTPALP